MRKIVLASKSYWRKKLLEQIGLKNFEIRASAYQEDMQAKSDYRELAKFLALGKGKEVASHYDDAIIIAGDTFAIFENEFLGKPKTEQRAMEMLTKFSGNEVLSISGLAVIDTKSGKIVNDYGEAKVKFQNLSEREIENYVKKTQPLNLAGGFGIMAEAGVLVEKVEGDFYSIVALPINKVYSALKELGVDIFEIPPIDAREG